MAGVDRKTTPRPSDYYLQSAEKGYFEVRRKSLMLMMRGIGVKQDLAKVFEWTHKFAAER